MRVFISYRRDDSMVTAALLYRELAGRAEFADAFMDIDDIGYGDDFIAAIERALQAADVVVVVIGPRWTEMLQARQRGDDWVRHEVATALRMSGDPARAAALRVMPILVGGAAPPREKDLPVDLAALPRLSMLSFDERALKASINTVLESLQKEGFEDRTRRLEAERRSAEEAQRRLEGDRRSSSRARMTSVAAAFALFLAGWVSLFDFFGLDTRVASATMLLAAIAGPDPAWSGEVVLVAIDEASERAVGRKFDASWRAEHAVVIARAASAAARSLAFDMVLEDPGSEAANAALASALATTREKMPVVFGVQRRAGPGEGVMLAPFATLARQGVACAGLTLGQARSMPLAVQRAAPAPAAAASAGAGRPPEPFAPSFALAAYSGGGRIELLDESDQNVLVRLRTARRTQPIGYYAGETIVDPQPACDVLQPGDRVLSQLVDPFTLPPLRAAPQRIAYEQVLAGEPAALALLDHRIVLVGTLLPGIDRIPLSWPAEDRWGVELIAAQLDAMAREVAIRPIDPIAEWALMSGLALLGAYVAHRLRERPRALRIAALTAIALVWIAAAIYWYRTERQLIGVPYDLAALALGAWLTNRTWRRTLA